MSSELLLFNGRIHTMDPRAPLASAIAIREGRVVRVGDEDAARDALGPDREEFDLEGRCAVPGLTDSHVHFAWFAHTLEEVDAGAPSLEESVSRVRDRAERSAPGSWITGSGWDHNVWKDPGGSFPSWEHLDRVSPRNPVALNARSGHALWVNSLALRAAGISASTADSEGGRIVRAGEAASAPRPAGLLSRASRLQPTGVLLENAMRLVLRVIPAPSAEELAGLMRTAQEAAHRAGVTCIHDFDSEIAFRAFQMLEDRGELTLRVVKGIPHALLGEAIALGLRTGFGGERLSVGPVKIFADGALGSRTAWLLEPYAQGARKNPERGIPNGIALMTEEQIFDCISRANSAGISCAVHAIGDAAVRAALNAFDRCSRSEGATGNGPRNRIEHAQLLHPDDLPRLAQLGIVASMQPVHATSDMEMAERYWGGRCAGAYAWRSLLDAGTALAFGSDSPVESLDPLAGIHAAVTRRRPDGSPGPDGWHPAQRISVEEAVRAYTVGAAWAAGRERDLGCLAPGMRADLTVLERDIFAIDPQDIKDAGVHATIVGGKIVYRSG